MFQNECGREGKVEEEEEAQIEEEEEAQVWIVGSHKGVCDAPVAPLSMRLL